MLYLDRIKAELEREISKLRVDGTQKLPSIREHDMVVGQISGIEIALNIVDIVKKQMESMSDPEESDFGGSVPAHRPRYKTLGQ